MQECSPPPPAGQTHAGRPGGLGPAALRAQKVGVTFLTPDLKNWHLGRFALNRAQRTAAEEKQGTTGPKSQSWGSGIVFMAPGNFLGS